MSLPEQGWTGLSIMVIKLVCKQSILNLRLYVQNIQY